MSDFDKIKCYHCRNMSKARNKDTACPSHRLPLKRKGNKYKKYPEKKEEKI